MSGNQYFEMYCGMWEERARSLLALEAGQHVHPATVALFFENGLVMPDKKTLTIDGQTLARKVLNILAGNFMPPQSDYDDASWEKVNRTELRGLARRKMCKANGIKSIHLKALRAMVLHPGQCRNWLEHTYGADALRHLQMRGFLVGGSLRIDAIYPTGMAYSWMKMLSE